MTKQDLMAYILETPGNTNPAILSQKIDEVCSGSAEEKDYTIVELKRLEEVENSEEVPDVIKTNYPNRIYYYASSNYFFNELIGKSNVFFIGNDEGIDWQVLYGVPDTENKYASVGSLGNESLINYKNSFFVIFEDSAFYIKRALS